MNFRLLLALACFAPFATALVSAADDLRFSQALAPAEVLELGLNRLSSDQIAVLDALVRRDEATNAASRTPKLRALRFSQRISDDERHNAGLTLLDEAQLSRVDERIKRFIAPPPPTEGGYSMESLAKPTVYTARSLRREPEIHGSVTLVYGVGSGGYSERGGAMTLTYEDPANRFAIAVGYAEMHTKGGYINRYCRDGFSRWPNDPWW